MENLQNMSKCSNHDCWQKNQCYRYTIKPNLYLEKDNFKDLCDYTYDYKYFIEEPRNKRIVSYEW